MAFQAERLATGNLINDPRIHATLQAQVEANNDIVREIAEQMQVPLAETARIAEREEWMIDDCHCNREGHAERAQILLGLLKQEGLLPDLEGNGD